MITEGVLRHTVAYRYRYPIIGHRARAPKHILLRLLGVQTASIGLLYVSKTIINETGFYVRSIGYEDVAYNNL